MGEAKPVGRPPAYSSVEELQGKVDEYFATIELSGKPATISGLAFHLGFESKQSVYDYEKFEEFTYPIKRARLRIEVEYEQKLSGNSVTGSIFALKNMGWKDKTEQDITTAGDKINSIQVEVIRKTGYDAKSPD